MGFWPFSGSKKQKADSEKHAQEKSVAKITNDDTARLEKAAAGLGSRPTNVQETDQRSKTLSRGRVTSYGPQTPRISTAPVSVNDSRRQISEKRLYSQDLTSQSSLGPDRFNVVRQPPTLHARRSEQEGSITRRKSSKRKAENFAREREVRAMSSSPMTIPGPRRPASFYDHGPLMRETRDVPGDLNKKFHRPTSQVSLPLPDRISESENASHQNSFKISMFAALSPRPSVKYDASPRSSRGKQAQRQVLTPKSTIIEEEDDDKARIDDLADDLDASALRELMERDRRRRERKKESDKAKLERRLQRRAERQREEEERKARVEAYVSNSATQLAGLNVDSNTTTAAAAAAVASSSLERTATQAGPSRRRSTKDKDPFADPAGEGVAAPVVIRNPFEDENDMDIMQDPTSSPEAEPIVPIKSPLRTAYVQEGSGSGTPQAAQFPTPTVPVAERQSTSQGSLLNREATEDLSGSAVLDRRASDQSSQRLSSWTNFFKRGDRRKVSVSLGRSTPSEFSNTSRESFARRPPPVVPQRTFRLADSATPQRTMSKFREDLPELPSPQLEPDLQSADVVSSGRGGIGGQTVRQRSQTPITAGIDEQAGFTPSKPIATPGNRLIQRGSTDLDVTGNAKAEMMLSQSLASVDSEASWLSGRPLNRLSSPSQRQKPSISSLTRSVAGVAEIDPAGGLSSRSAQDAPSTAAVVIPDETWHSGLGRQPTLIRQASRAKSKEGLLNEYAANESRGISSGGDNDDNDDEREEEEEEDADKVGDNNNISTNRNDNEDESPEREEDKELQAAPIMRARSVNYKSHIRHISGGSARLLDIRPSSISSEASLARTQSQKQAPPAASLVNTLETGQDSATSVGGGSGGGASAAARTAEPKDIS